MKRLLGGFGVGHVVAGVVALACLHCSDDPEKPAATQTGGAGGEPAGEGGSESQIDPGGSGPQGDSGSSNQVGGGAAGETPVAGMSGAGGEGPLVIEGDHYGFVFDELTMPLSNPQAMEVAFNVDADADTENQFGKAMASLTTQGFDVNQGIIDKTQDGSLIMLADLQASSLASANGAGLLTFYGADPEPMPCALNDCGHHLDGSGSFSVAASPAGVVTPGRITAAVFDGQGGELPVQLGFAGGVLELVLHDARAELIELSEDGFTGRLGGLIPQVDVDSQIYPALHIAFASFVTQDCTGGVAPGCGCVTPSTGKTYLDLMDTDDDCVLTVAEVKASPLVSAVFALDVDSDGDDEPDAMSCAFAVSAKKATFELP